MPSHAYSESDSVRRIGYSTNSENSTHAGARRTTVPTPTGREPADARCARNRGGGAAAAGLSRKRSSGRRAVDARAGALDRFQDRIEAFGLQHELLETLHRDRCEVVT